MITRREFSLAAVAGLVGARAAGVDTPALKDVRRYTINVGATEPFDALHISDTHLALADMVDGKPSPANAPGRGRIFPDAALALRASILHARARGEMLINTGDLIDYVNEANLSAAAKYVAASRGGLLAAGNHEYCQMVGDGKSEDEAYKAASRQRVQSVYPGNLLFASRIVNGVNFVLLDNIYYYIPAGVPEMFEVEVARALPIVVCCHVPFYTEALYALTSKGSARNPPWVCGAPDALVDQVADPHRRMQQRADARTHAFVARLRREPLLKAILCGHLHWPNVSDFAPGVPQYCVSANYMFHANEYSFV